jgi:hypothetical protein
MKQTHGFGREVKRCVEYMVKRIVKRLMKQIRSEMKKTTLDLLYPQEAMDRNICQALTQ